MHYRRQPDRESRRFRGMACSKEVHTNRSRNRFRLCSLESQAQYFPNQESSLREFQAHGQTISAYLAVPEHGSGPGVVVLHAWWDLTDVFKHVCDRLARAGFIALAPDLYHGKTTASVEQAQALGEALDQDVPRWRGDITAAMQIVRQQAASNQADGRGRLTIVGFSLRGACALDMSS